MGLHFLAPLAADTHFMLLKLGNVSLCAPFMAKGFALFLALILFVLLQSKPRVPYTHWSTEDLTLILQTKRRGEQICFRVVYYEMNL